jgi:rhodanese-related sulfurtransferase
LLSVAELQQRRHDAADFVLLDVREPWEIALAALPGATAIPLNEIPGRLKELDADREIIVMCKVGARSQMAADFLLASGFTRVFNLQGGIDAWSRDIDARVPVY